MGIKLSAYYHGRFVQMLRYADGIMDKLKAIEYYEKHMEEVNNDFLPLVSSAKYHDAFVKMMENAEGIMNVVRVVDYYMKHMEEVEADFLTEAWGKGDDSGKAS